MTISVLQGLQIRFIKLICDHMQASASSAKNTNPDLSVSSEVISSSENFYEFNFNIAPVLKMFAHCSGYKGNNLVKS